MGNYFRVFSVNCLIFLFQMSALGRGPQQSPPTPQRASRVSRIQIDATLKVNGRDSISIVVLVKHKYQKSIKQILMELMCLI